MSNFRNRDRSGSVGGNVTAAMTSEDYYFDSYSHFGIHEEMLKDQVRTRSYMNAIENNRHLFEGKIVLDIGCGTGILSMFAARAGASKVYAIECSAIAEQAKKIIEDNGYADTIEVIQKKMEDVELPCKHVDIILSEWMGYFLLYESMLDTVLYARDKYLNPDTGIMLPDQAVLYMCGIEDGQYRAEKIDFWDNVYGFNMKVIKDMAIDEPLVDSVDSRSVMTSIEPILKLNIRTCTKEDLTFQADFVLKSTRQDFCHALCAFFDVYFTQIHKPILLSTSPLTQYTHWKQTVFYLNGPITMCQGESLPCSITCKPNDRNARDLDIIVSHEFKGACMEYDKKDQLYRLR